VLLNGQAVNILLHSTFLHRTRGSAERIIEDAVLVSGGEGRLKSYLRSFLLLLFLSSIDAQSALIPGKEPAVPIRQRLIILQS